MGSTPVQPRRGRGRPARSEEEVKDIRSRIAQCASTLFQQEGVEAVSMRRLALEVGCTVMTLYKYFERKIDVLRALWAQVFTELFDELDKIAGQPQTAGARLNGIALGYVMYWLERRESYFLVFMSSGVTQPDVSIFVGDEPVMARFDLFRRSVQAALGEQAEDAAFKSELLLCSLNGISHSLITISAFPWSTPEKLVSAAVSGVLKA